jgi:hypothetical protein
MLASGKIFLDIAQGIILLTAILGFHIISRVAFVAVFDVSKYRLGLLYDLYNSPSLILYYLVPIAIHMAIAFLSVYIRFLINRNLNLVDVAFITAIPAFLYIFYIEIEHQLLKIHDMPRLSSPELESQFQYHPSLFGRLVEASTAYLFNTAILFVGGYFGWLFLKSLSK